MKQKLVFLLLASSLFGCSFQKRLYNSGYYHETSSRTEKPEVPSKQLASEAVLPTAHDEKQVGAQGQTDRGLSVSANPAVSNILPKTELPQGCDTLFLLGGKRTEVLIQEVTPSVIKYKLCDEPDGALRIVNRNSASEIHYATGVKESFGKSDIEKSGRGNSRRDSGTERGGRNSNTNRNGDHSLAGGDGQMNFILGLCSVACLFLLFPILLAAGISTLGSAVFVLGVVLGLIAFFRGRKQLRYLNKERAAYDKDDQKMLWGKWLGIPALVLAILAATFVIIGLVAFFVFIFGYMH
jgi:hypothetical protein